ncbi:methionine ABC transporter ATP-binding protein [Corynebacterium sp. 153RC1]|uniref:methionine ABC transporter ATP-binding protein n=1 Tax=unclassified Corynebacterium TaxID=2624378 RepID=UPI00211C66A3|nr:MULTISPECIES: methionine ABC transporter ATP-binding protein [unclassified Corynebacterium]MCQ9369969.1 methionine ABC transporter ATP-binding protein [Corynebacterium sp. 35RC1]MCQ9352188.1 methionine ABC transporter ATP-binding protein [Corynebacterium sp. 209RC1]MCQ9354191.1 methionine ABC transporter ATP-binding protein [Corynebacterium sp. 1222RC1]MCQ9356471.1 methionine ABC transporter ATP-binding protein [Corynebacterium sp. 122RC1]MCQ9358573.1 methionine ABC transporter ATP-binding 
MSGTRIEFEGISKVFTSGKRTIQALEDVTLTVEPGEILGVIGYSGAGKSTLVRLINGLDTPTSGHLRLDGVDIVGMPESGLRQIRKGIGMIFQQFNLFNSRTAAGNIAYPLKLAGVPKPERERRVQELLEFVGLGDRGRNYPEQLSGGQKQRVGIARALANNPALLLADEATSALDPETTHDVLELLRKVNREFGITIVVITHEMEVVRSIADKVAVMENGRVVEYGSTYEVFSNPRTGVAKRFVATALRNTPDAIESEDLLAHEGRLFTITLSESSDFFTAAANAKAAGASINIVHGGVTTLQRHSFGKITVRLQGPDQAIDDFFAHLNGTTDIKEIR